MNAAGLNRGDQDEVDETPILANHSLYVRQEVRRFRFILWALLAALCVVCVGVISLSYPSKTDNAVAFLIIGSCSGTLIFLVFFAVLVRYISWKVKHQIVAETYVIPAQALPEHSLASRFVRLLNLKQWIAVIVIVIVGYFFIRTLQVNSNKASREANVCNDITVSVDGSKYTISDTGRQNGSAIIGSLQINGNSQPFDYMGTFDFGQKITHLVLLTAALSDGAVSSGSQVCNKQFFP